MVYEVSTLIIFSVFPTFRKLKFEFSLRLILNIILQTGCEICIKYSKNDIGLHSRVSLC